MIIERSSRSCIISVLKYLKFGSENTAVGMWTLGDASTWEIPRNLGDAPTWEISAAPPARGFFFVPDRSSVSRIPRGPPP